MAVAAMQSTDQHIRKSLGFTILPKDALTCRPGELNQQPSVPFFPQYHTTSSQSGPLAAWLAGLNSKQQPTDSSSKLLLLWYVIWEVAKYDLSASSLCLFLSLFILALFKKKNLS